VRTSESWEVQVEDKAVQSSLLMEQKATTNQSVSGDDSFFQAIHTLSISEETDVDVSGKELHHIPNLKGTMPLLELLDASSNMIVSIGTLPDGLIELRLGNNRLRSFEFLSNLKNLLCLDLKNNGIKQVDFVSALTRLEILNLDDNDICDISFIKYLPCLRDLSLVRNEIRSIRINEPNEILQRLNLAMNSLVTAPGINLLHGLEELCIDSNSLSEFRFMGILPNLKRLKLRFNRLSEFSVDIVPNIEALFLDNNAFEWCKHHQKRSLNLARANQLRCLSLNGNDLRYADIAWPPLLSTLYLEHCMMKQLPINLVSSCPNLGHLFLQQNFLSDTQNLTPLNQLELLDLYDNTLKDISSLCLTLQTLTSLKVLDLRYESILDNGNFFYQVYDYILLYWPLSETIPSLLNFILIGDSMIYRKNSQ
jgi:hypothetical protein